MTKRSLTTKTNCVAVDRITIRLFNEAGGFIEEFTAIDTDYGIFIPEWDEDSETELMEEIFSIAEDHFQQTRTDRMPFFG